MSVVFPVYAQTYTARRPYLTPAEYMAYPTGVNLDNLVPGGSETLNAQALAEAIASGSGWVDSICKQVVAATNETTVRDCLIRNDGWVTVPTQYWPIAAVESVQVGDESPVQPNPADIREATVRVRAQQSRGRVPVVVKYVAGFASALTTGQVMAGATVIPVDNVLGIAPGMSLTVYDPVVSEYVTVAAVSDMSITVTAPLTQDHGPGVNVSALPPAVKQATVLLTTATIKTRAAQAIQIASTHSQPQVVAANPPGVTTEESIAAKMLRPFTLDF